MAEGGALANATGFISTST
ncbi:hypothetical protein A2U01_0029049, partial [Trifolium medium]|nr:hypothetical protein [Trifolium medium]